MPLTAVIVFRETLEIAMILGIVLASTRGLARRGGWIAGGFAAGTLGAALVALFTRAISNSVSGMGQELFNAAVLFAAAFLIGCTVIWMKKHAHQMSVHLKQVGHDVSVGTLPLYTLSVIIGLAMLREGSEIVLFLYSMLISGESGISVMESAGAGLLLGIVTGGLLYLGLLKLPAKHALKITSWLLILLVAGLMSQGAAFLSAAGYFSEWSQPLWDSSWLLSEESLTGKTLHAMMGYSSNPTSIQLLFYIASLMVIIAVLKRGETRVAKHAVAVAAFCIAAHTATGSQPALALDHLYSPIIEKGELEVEYSGDRSFDNDSTKNNIQGHEFELEYGVNDFWKVIAEGAFTKEPQKSFKSDKVEIASLFQFTEQGKYWADVGMFVAYGIATQSHAADDVEAKLLVQKDTSEWTHLTNLVVEQAVGNNAHGGPEYSLLWNSRYRWNEHAEPGIEIQSSFGNGHTLGKYDEQSHYVGPAVYGDIYGPLKYEVAYLFGVSKAADDGAARIKLEYEFHF